MHLLSADMQRCQISFGVVSLALYIQIKHCLSFTVALSRSAHADEDMMIRWTDLLLHCISFAYFLDHKVVITLYSHCKYNFEVLEYFCYYLFEL